MSTNPRTSRERVAQYTRVGICNGEKCREDDKWKDVALWRIGEDRWRCARCFKIETGHAP